MIRRFDQVDVFSSADFSGNPLAVVHDADGLSDDDMARFTSWTNLSEATFVLPPTSPDADYRVRIFCPGRELPFAGHPTLGTCAAWLAAGGSPHDPGTVVQECGAGLVPIRRTDDRLAFAAPPLLRSGPVAADELAERLDQLGLDDSDVVAAEWVDNGPGWMALLLPTSDAVLDVGLPTGRIPGFHVGLVGPRPEGDDCALEVRAFFADPVGSIREDPVTGSLNAALAQWLIAAGRIEAPYTAAQGTAMGRRGRVDVAVADGATWIGGRVDVRVSGTVDI